jgi:pyruvate formate lyase activating enzyme
VPAERSNYIARYWGKIDSKSLQCLLCPRKCKLAQEQRGFCFARQNHDGNLILTTYGKSSGFCIDPIEKKPLYHFYPGSATLSFGTVGCNLGCKFCQNWELSRAHDFERLGEVASPESIANAAIREGCQSVSFTYNEPAISAEYIIDVAQICRQRKIKTVAVSAGYIAGPARHDFFEYIDAANIDLKGFTEKFYKTMTLGSLAPVLETLIFIKKKTKTWLEITNLLIPTQNDSTAEINKMTLWIVENLGTEVPLHFSAFHPDYQLVDLPTTALKILTQAREIAINNGLKFVYTGNAYDPEGSRTSCVQCGKVLIDRAYFAIQKYVLKDVNHCPNCSSICAGEFGVNPGHWGTKRLPIDIRKY